MFPAEKLVVARDVKAKGEQTKGEGNVASVLYAQSLPAKRAIHTEDNRTEFYLTAIFTSELRRLADLVVIDLSDFHISRSFGSQRPSNKFT